MSERDLRRIEVLSDVRAGRRTVAAAAAVLAISARQAFRLLARYEADGGSGLIHKARGRISNRSHNEGIRNYAVELVKTRYADFGPTLATEVLLDKHQLRIGKETLRRWMMAEGLWLSRTQRRTFHQPRLRRESYGELVQIDGSDHRWFEQRGEPCTLLVFIDDATSKLTQLRFVPSESTDSYFEALQGYLQVHGCPVAFYSDKHTVFRVNKPDAKGGQGMTQFGRALAELNIEILCANSSQAKGRVERANRTLQDRLVKELRLANSSDMAAGNEFLPGFLERFNEKFALAPARTENLHRRLNVQASQLTDILCHRELRHVSQQLSLAYDRRQILLERSELADKLPGQYVEVYDFADRPPEVRWKGHLLPYGVFSRDQRVSHTATIENKRLSHALTIVRAQQELKRPTTVLTSSAKGGYMKRGRKLYGPDYVEKPPAPKAVEICKIAKCGDFTHSHSTTATALY
ncbi:putative insertion sequence transposase protein [Granulicella sibirica]|uniref:Putative insertion sequence transposase protein n=1 Tax=Granulicella sibirica TaxID=2479048 RepID=A0A4Q0STE5_9BACT|nr:putative insertion sequence transposase protein [Granulicella sibirica]